jgi:hypothetical protein
VIGEIIIKRTYGRIPRHLLYRQKNQGNSSETKG